ncbi:MAG: hypothetical protein COY66_02295 [Candidatus Kerfeldbacteria bacterium CG_4_10_14_0_8_um_filter_42_10]|uniref:Uncharacterized protein n=1 Tax=Candidatus Kerfeldbacteria bacterium CG_4_10_14_0_8_um_filter_42_10 TaxID=2014248 RepID=A0A2M7RJZ5_9BACT|nr:MAG: hypothetical protein COY66_02295 [Candidatus Kerfeldbacteria bacterium CG_4_10_14_0_8_um_filter_42_10]
MASISQIENPCFRQGLFYITGNSLSRYSADWRIRGISAAFEFSILRKRPQLSQMKNRSFSGTDYLDPLFHSGFRPLF